MNGILWGKFRRFLRKPGAFLITTIICAVFAFLLGSSSFTKVEIPVFAKNTSNAEAIVQELNKSDSFQFKLIAEKAVLQQIEDGKSDLGADLADDSYTVYRAADTETTLAVNRYLEKYYQNRFKKQQIINNAQDKKEAETKVEAIEKEPLLPITFAKSQQQSSYDQSLQALFGFTLFFSIYTVANTVVEILRDKQNGIWDRFILSSTSKTQLYLGHLFFSFFLGYMQIMLIFLIFRFGTGVDFHGNFAVVFGVVIPYLYAIVALTILLTGLVKTVSQFNAFIPLVAVSFAMLGGAYWPMEIVKSDFLLLLAKFVPVTYGMELLKRGIIEGAAPMELLFPVGILMLMGTVMLGVGIRLIERRHV
ncbi:ABC transporter permease [Niallia taxi]|uniref:ABC transporter permease n=1 Tax=Niallia taxi TaxID=2499688 RepID=UPI002934F921|nr:ABC transporter permease [Niallia taxi]WOD62583.1 ABC transporter permease [Niallia taxi]